MKSWSNLWIEYVKMESLSTENISRIIEMAWEDRTPFEAIEVQYGLSEKEVKALMRNELKPSSYKLWRKRVNGRNTKHRAKRSDNVTRFRCPDQR